MAEPPEFYFSPMKKMRKVFPKNENCHKGTVKIPANCQKTGQNVSKF
jgi:hypothetical protein